MNRIFLVVAISFALASFGRAQFKKSAPGSATSSQLVKPTENQGTPAAGNRGVNFDLLKQFLEAFNRHDLDAIMAFFAEDCSLYLPRGPKPRGQRFAGKAQVRHGLAVRFSGIPDVHYGDDRHWVCGELGVSEWTLTGTSTSGVHLEVRGVDARV